MILLLDNYDSFTFILKDYLLQCGEEVIVKENTDNFDDIVSLSFTHIVLSPGPKTPKQSGCLVQLVEHAAENKIPTLGVCLGHQAIGEFFGARLKKGLKPMHGKVSTISHTKHLLFNGVPTEFEVCRYNSLIISDIKDSNLKSIASSIDGEIMALAHDYLPLWAVQFHPEAILTQFGSVIIRNWLKYCH